MVCVDAMSHYLFELTEVTRGLIIPQRNEETYGILSSLAVVVIITIWA